jgi:hypothetical protein
VVKASGFSTYGKDKLILTTRPTLFSEILDILPSHGKSIEKLLLPKLPYEQTKEMFKKELPGLKNRQVLHLTDLSKGVPNVMQITVKYQFSCIVLKEMFKTGQFLKSSEI